MTFPTLNLFLPAILAVHNAEEYSRFEEFVLVYRGRIPKRLVTRDVFRNAAVLITITALAVSVSTYLGGGTGWIRVSMIATLALAFNAITHCVLSLRKRALTPGSWSALALVLPYSAISIAAMRATMGTSWRLLLGLAALGIGLTPVAVGLFLVLGYAVAVGAARR